MRLQRMYEVKFLVYIKKVEAVLRDVFKIPNI